MAVKTCLTKAKKINKKNPCLQFTVEVWLWEILMKHFFNLYRNLNSLHQNSANGKERLSGEDKGVKWVGAEAFPLDPS